jgi:hypothetical protein
MKMSNLMDAHVQWASRPADQRFWTLQDLRESQHKIKTHSAVRQVNPRQIVMKAVKDNGLVMEGPRGRATLSHFAFGQMSSLVGAPAGYLRSLPAELAAANLNNGLQKRELDGNGTMMLFDTLEGCKARAITSDGYGRIWNVDVVDKLIPLTEKGWRVAPARPCGNEKDARIATEADCLKNRMPGLGVKPGDMIAPAGLYGSDKDMFVFLINEDRQIKAGTNLLSRGFFVENSEVGDRAFKITTFLYNFVCGNHCVWSASEINRFKVVHKGEQADRRAWHSLGTQLKTYQDEGVEELEAKIITFQNKSLGKSEAEVVDTLWSKNIAPKATIEEAYKEAVKHPEDGHTSPRSVWGMVQGFTRMSQASPYADTRVGLDRAAGKILALAN